MDLLGPFPPSRKARYTHVLVITEHMSKWTLALPMHTTDSWHMLKLLHEEVVLRYGVPRYVLSNNRPNFKLDEVPLCRTVQHRMAARSAVPRQHTRLG